MSSTAAPGGFRGEYLSELAIAERQILAMADAIPQEKYGWRPVNDARSVSEVLVHLAVGHLMLLEMAGVPAPGNLYSSPSADPQERILQIIHRNDEMEKTIVDKGEITALLRRSLEAARNGFTASDDAFLERARVLFAEPTTVRRLYMRLLAHLHEHMGQLTGYVRMNGMKAPWPDWRPDRR